MRPLLNTMKLLAFLFFMMLVSQPLLAQPPDDDDPVNTPFDGGVSLLIAAAVGYGAKKVRDEKKKNKDVLSK